MKEVKDGLKLLKELDDELKDIAIKKQTAIDLVLTDDVKISLANIDAEFGKDITAIKEEIVSCEAVIKARVIAHGATVKDVYQAVYNKPRVSWDKNALVGYAATRPEMEQFKTTGKPSVSIRRK